VRVVEKTTFSTSFNQRANVRSRGSALGSSATRGHQLKNPS
jgi:hypothetical protein